MKLNEKTNENDGEKQVVQRNMSSEQVFKAASKEDDPSTDLNKIISIRVKKWRERERWDNLNGIMFLIKKNGQSQMK